MAKKEVSVIEKLKVDHKVKILELLQISGDLLVGLVNEYINRSINGDQTDPLKHEIKDLMESMLMDKQRMLE